MARLGTSIVCNTRKRALKKNNSAESYLYECIRILFHSFVIESLKCVRLIYGTLHIVMALLIWQLEQINRVTNTVQ